MQAHYGVRKALESEVLGLYDVYSEKYQTNVETYLKLFDERKRLKIPSRRGDKLSEAKLREYPEIPFLNASSRRAAEQMLPEMSDAQIRALIGTIGDLPTNHVYRAITGLITDFKHQINQRDARNKPFGADPKSCKVRYGKAFG